MKIFRLFTAILFLATTQLSFSQSSWLEENPSWYYNITGHTVSGFQKNYYEKDTIIQDLSFQVFSCYSKSWDFWSESFSERTNESCFYVREEDNIVYFYHTQFDTIYELYNFNSMPGDTLKIPPPDFPNCLPDTTPKDLYSVAIVESVDTIYIHGEPLKRFIIDYEVQPDEQQYPIPIYSLGYEIIEKIGSTIYFFPSYWDLSSGCLPSGLIRCYENNKIPLYNFNEGVDCDYITTNINKKAKEDFFVYPNPVSSTAKINVENCDKIHKIELWAIDGKRVPIQYNNCEVDFSKIKAGTYILTIHFNNKTINTKIQKI